MEQLWDIESDLFCILDNDYEGHIYTEEDIFNFEMGKVPFPDETNFYCQISLK